jgi:hypothetical protein
MVEVPWNGFRGVSFAVGVIGTLEFVGGLGDARENSSRHLAGGGEICLGLCQYKLVFPAPVV